MKYYVLKQHDLKRDTEHYCIFRAEGRFKKRLTRDTRLLSELSALAFEIRNKRSFNPEEANEFYFTVPDFAPHMELTFYNDIGYSQLDRGEISDLFTEMSTLENKARDIERRAIQLSMQD